MYFWAWFSAWIRRACLVLLLVPGPGPWLDLWTFGPLDLDPWTWPAGTIQALTIDD